MAVAKDKGDRRRQKRGVEGDQGPERVARLMARRGLASRREAERWIEAGRVTVNGEVRREPGLKADPRQDEILVDGRPLPGPRKQHTYLALNKPPGILASFRKDREKGGTLEEVVRSPRRLFPAGRLDRDSTGLLLLTTDGEWANRVMHPRYEKEKEYLVRFRGMRPTPAARRFREASFREAGRAFSSERAEPAGSYVRVVLKEGRKRQIRRLAEEAGLEVAELIRVRIGPVELGDLKPGKTRPLTGREVRELGRNGEDGEKG